MERLILITGNDSIAVKTNALKLAKVEEERLLSDLSFEIINDDDKTKPLDLLERFILSLKTPNFFGGQRVLWLKHFSHFKLLTGKTKQNQKVQELFKEIIDEVSSDLQEELLVIIDGVNLDKRSSFYKSCKKVGKIHEYNELKSSDRNDNDYGMKQGWMKNVDIKKYDSVKVNVFIYAVQYPSSWWDNANARYVVSNKSSDEVYISNYIKDSFTKSLEKYTDLKVVDKVGPKTLELDFAIVKLVPNGMVVGTITNILGITPIGLLLSPLKVFLKSLYHDNGGAIAMETMIKDSQSKKVEGVFADKENGKTALFINFNEFLAYSNVRVIVDLWTEEIAKILNSAKTGDTYTPTYRKDFVLIDY